MGGGGGGGGGVGGVKMKMVELLPVQVFPFT